MDVGEGAGRRDQLHEWSKLEEPAVEEDQICGAGGVGETLVLVEEGKLMSVVAVVWWTWWKTVW